MTLQHFADDLITKSCKVSDVYDDSTLNDVLIESRDASIHHSLQHYWASHPQADLTDIAFYANSLLAIQKSSRDAAHKKKVDDLARPYKKKPWQCTLANNVNKNTTSSPTRGTRKRSRSHPVLHINPYHSKTTAPRASSTSSSSIPSIASPKRNDCYDIAHTTSTCRLPPRETPYRSR